MKDPVYIAYSIEHFLWKHHLTFFAFLVRGIMRLVFSCDIPYKATIGKGALFPHYALGIVIHPDAIIGKNCQINQNVTIGGRSGLKTLPTIGDNVLIGAGAKVIGSVVIGNNVQIGANAVVVKDIPDNCVVVGVPARIIKKDGKKFKS